MDSPDALLYEAVLTRLTTQVPEIRYIEQDLGQLENYGSRPAVTWPCALLDIDDFDFSDAGNDLIQIGKGYVQVRVGLVKYTDSNNLTPSNIRVNAYNYMETAYKVVKALHGWAPTNFSRLLRRKVITEKRDDDIRVKIIRFEVTYQENLSPARTPVARPSGVIGIEK